MMGSDQEEKAELGKIKRAMSANGYPKKFMGKAIQRHTKNSATGEVKRTEDLFTLVSLQESLS